MWINIASCILTVLAYGIVLKQIVVVRHLEQKFSELGAEHDYSLERSVGYLEIIRQLAEVQENDRILIEKLTAQVKLCNG
jgi:hypothetical protein